MGSLEKVLRREGIDPQDWEPPMSENHMRRLLEHIRGSQGARGDAFPEADEVNYAERLNQLFPDGGNGSMHKSLFERIMYFSGPLPEGVREIDYARCVKGGECVGATVYLEDGIPLWVDVEGTVVPIGDGNEQI